MCSSEEARPGRFELPTTGSVDQCSIQLSYGRERNGADHTLEGWKVNELPADGLTGRARRNDRKSFIVTQGPRPPCRRRAREAPFTVRDSLKNTGFLPGSTPMARILLRGAPGTAADGLSLGSWVATGHTGAAVGESSRFVLPSNRIAHDQLSSYRAFPASLQELSLSSIH